MRNPWLGIPAEDYEAHMALPEVAQTQALAAVFADALRASVPESLAVIGCATGGGFQHIDPAGTKRIVGVDINAEYLAILRDRFEKLLPGLELIEADIGAEGFAIEPVDMVFAALIFEYVDVGAALRVIESGLKRGGTLVAVLQLPSSESAPVTRTPYTSVLRLEPIMRLVPPEDFTQACEAAGLRSVGDSTVPLKSGKAFFVASYRKG